MSDAGLFLMLVPVVMVLLFIWTPRRRQFFAEVLFWPVVFSFGAGLFITAVR